MSTPIYTIFLCVEERSGSEWLCDMMSNTGVLGRPQGYFSADGMRILSGRMEYPDDLSEQIKLARKLGTTNNGIFSVKTLSWHFQRLWKEDWKNNFPNPVYFRLQRRDHLRQAISLARARQTQVWHHDHTPIAKEKYSYGLIKELLVEISTNRSRWDLFFTSMGVEPITCYYEDLLKQPRTYLSKLSSAVGTPFGRFAVPVRTERKIQRDILTERWRQMYYLDYKRETGYGS